MADKELHELPLAQPLNGSELVHIVQGGNSRKAMIAQIKFTPIFEVNGNAIAPLAEHANAYLITTSSLEGVITLPSHATLPYEIGTVLTIEQGSTGVFALEGAAGVTVNVASTHNTRTNGQHSVVQVLKTGEDRWTVMGNLEPKP